MLQPPVQQGISGICTAQVPCCAGLPSPMKSQKFTEKFSLLAHLRNGHVLIAPIPLHPPVHGLHSTENQADKLAHFLLTQKLKGVKTYSFFDTF
jgi:hypothetical protein